MSLSVATTTSNPGRLYRALFCPWCGDTRLHVIEYLADDHTEQGYFVWFNRRCTGLEPCDDARRRVIMRERKPCGREETAALSRMQWNYLRIGAYY